MKKTTQILSLLCLLSSIVPLASARSASIPVRQCDSTGSVCVGDIWLMASVVTVGKHKVTQTQKATIIAFDANQNAICAYQNGQAAVCEGSFLFRDNEPAASVPNRPGPLHPELEPQCHDGDIFGGPPCIGRYGDWWN